MLDLGSEIRHISVEELEEDATTVLTTAELAECTCPEFCERDHDVD
jgi:hypothetical protein